MIQLLDAMTSLLATSVDEERVSTGAKKQSRWRKCETKPPDGDQVDVRFRQS